MRVVHVWVLLLLALFLGGCATGPQGLSPPRIRVGGLPYPGMTQYVALEEPQRLGQHRYQLFRALDEVADEVSAGIVYTRHGGFLDMAHVRSTADWVRYVYLVTFDRLMAPEPAAAEPLRWSWLGMDYLMVLRVPPAWNRLSAEQRLPLAREAASVVAQRMATVISTWHEVGSWYGQMIVPPFQEIRSAFTWDDSTSHVFAALVGGRALANGQAHNDQAWNAAVTRELAHALASLEPVGMACQREALAHAHGLWWLGGQTLRRDLDTGLQGPQAKQAWLLPELHCASRAGSPSAKPPPMALQLPHWDALELAHGQPVRAWFDWEVRVPDWLAQRVQGCEGACASRAFQGEADLLAAIELIRTQIVRDSGVQALRPDGGGLADGRRVSLGRNR